MKARAEAGSRARMVIGTPWTHGSSPPGPRSRETAVMEGSTTREEPYQLGACHYPFARIWTVRAGFGLGCGTLRAEWIRVGQNGKASRPGFRVPRDRPWRVGTAWTGHRTGALSGVGMEWPFGVIRADSRLDCRRVRHRHAQPAASHSMSCGSTPFRDAPEWGGAGKRWFDRVGGV